MDNKGSPNGESDLARSWDRIFHPLILWIQSFFCFNLVTLLDDNQNEGAIVKQISSWPVVKKVSPVRELHQPRSEVSTVAHGAAVRRSVTSHGIRRRDPTGHEGNDYPHIMVGVDKLRQEGYLGTGIRVAVVDTGVDYKHPALGGCFGKGCLVEFGFNFLENTTDPWEGSNGHGRLINGY